MDACQARPNAYDTLNRNKASFSRPPIPSSTSGLPLAFNSMAPVHSQVCPTPPAPTLPGDSKREI